MEGLKFKVFKCVWKHIQSMKKMKKKNLKQPLQTAEIQSKVRFFYVLSLSFIASQKILGSWKKMS